MISFLKVYKIVFVIGLLAFAVILVKLEFQLVGETAEQFRIYYSKTPAEKHESNFKFLFEYANIVTKRIKGHHTGRLITDRDITDDPGMLEQRVLAYFLYPIDIRMSPDEEAEVLLFYDKKDARNKMPPGYAPYITFTENADLLVSVKKR